MSLDNVIDFENTIQAKTVLKIMQLLHYRYINNIATLGDTPARFACQPRPQRQLFVGRLHAIIFDLRLQINVHLFIFLLILNKETKLKNLNLKLASDLREN